MRYCLPLAWLIIIGIIIWGCGASIISDRKEIPEVFWTYDQPMEFVFKAPDTTKLYNIHLTVEHTKSFDYQNIYMQLLTIFPKGDTLRQPFSLDVSDKFGQWTGDCGSDICRRTSVLQARARFEQLGKYKLIFEQFSRKDSLKGVHALELHVTPFTPES